MSLPGGLLQGFTRRSRPGRAYRTFWELQGGQAAQKGVPSDKTEVAGKDPVAESLSGQGEELGPKCGPAETFKHECSKKSLGKDCCGCGIAVD